MTEEIVEPVAGFRGWPRVAMWIAHAGFFAVGMALASFFATSLWATKPILGVMGFFVIAIASWKVLDLASTYLPRFPFIAGIYAAVFGVIGLPVAAIFGLIMAGIWLVLDGDGGTKFATDRPAVSERSVYTNSADGERRLAECFGELYPEQYAAQIRMLRSRGTSSFDAEEAASHALMKVCISYSKKDPKGTLRAFYTTSVRNAAIDGFRKTSKCEFADFDNIRRSDRDPYSPRFDPSDPDIRVQRTLDEFRCTFDEDEVRIIELTYKGFTQEEIATQLGLSRSNVAKKIERLKPRLSELLRN